MDADVPLLIPEVNAAHVNCIPVQQRNRKYDSGFIVTNPNCSTAGLVLAPFDVRCSRGHVAALESGGVLNAADANALRGALDRVGRGGLHHRCGDPGRRWPGHGPLGDMD